jgi:tRNA-dihydrouridine synthase
MTLHAPATPQSTTSPSDKGVPTTLRTGTLTLASPFLLSPMESVSDVGFRRLCHAQGAGLTYTEMIRARGIVRNNKSTLDLIDTHDPEVPTGLQLFVVSDVELLAALHKIEELASTTHPHFKNIIAVDLNFGCPSPEVIRIGAGPALLKRRNKLRAIFEALSTWKKTTTLPVQSVSAKIRLGLTQAEQDHKVYLPVVEMANDTLDHLVVHARNAKQKSSARALWSAIRECKAAAKIPLVGNGDVVTREDAERMFKSTGCDGIMVARAAIRSPWCFRGLRATGAPTGTLVEIEAAEELWRTWATRHQSKPKFFTWHEEGFARMRKVARGETPAMDLPQNEHMH